METDISDYDGDSQMASSPESSNAGSRTPVTNPSNARAAELSPPGSHQTQKTAGVSGGKGALFGGVEMDRNAAQQQQRQQKQQQQKGKSGDGRLNRRAEEEYQRVMEYVVDKDFSLSEYFLSFFLLSLVYTCVGWLWDGGPTAWIGRGLTRQLEEFGDPFDERDMEEELP